MFALLCTALGLSLAPPQDSVVRLVPTAPAETLNVTVTGPATGPTLVIIPGLISPAYAYRGLLGPLNQAGIRTVVVEPLGVRVDLRPVEDLHGDGFARPPVARPVHTPAPARARELLDFETIREQVAWRHGGRGVSSGPKPVSRTPNGLKPVRCSSLAHVGDASRPLSPGRSPVDSPLRVGLASRSR